MFIAGPPCAATAIDQCFGRDDLAEPLPQTPRTARAAASTAWLVDCHCVFRNTFELLDYEHASALAATSIST